MSSLPSGKHIAHKAPPKQALATAVTFGADTFSVALQDGRTVTFPIGWSPMLAKATPAQRLNYRLMGGGVGIHWPDLDEDMFVRRLLVADGDVY